MPRGIPNPTRINRKLCYGPSHPNPCWQPYSNFNRVKGKIWYECKDCHAFRRKTKKPYSRFLFHEIEFAVTELIHRLGKAEAARRIGISKQQISHYVNHNPRWIRRETAMKILRALSHVREYEEVRHRDSIHNGSHLRGQPEKQVTAKKHLYKRAGDEEYRDRTKRRRIQHGVKKPRDTDWG